jgi:hypothetical protein
LRLVAIVFDYGYSPRKPTMAETISSRLGMKF